MKIIRYKSKDIIKAGFLFEDNLIINFDDLEISNKNNLTKHDLYV